jgi:hypothetical protein
VVVYGRRGVHYCNCTWDAEYRELDRECLCVVWLEGLSAFWKPGELPPCEEIGTNKTNDRALGDCRYVSLLNTR